MRRFARTHGDLGRRYSQVGQEQQAGPAHKDVRLHYGLRRGSVPWDRLDLSHNSGRDTVGVAGLYGIDTAGVLPLAWRSEIK